MKKIIFVICLLLVMTSFGGCEMKDTLKYKIKYKEEYLDLQNAFSFEDKTYTKIEEYFKTSKLIRSRDELIALCYECNSPAFSKDSDKYNSEINQLIRSFDSDYFNSKALVICAGFHMGDCESLTINGISKDDENLIVNCTYEETEMSITVVRRIQWVFIVEVDKDDVKEINHTQYTINYKFGD